MVNVKPFDINYKDIKATVGGSHGFDQQMNYNSDVPAKYLGTETNALIAKLTPADAAKMQSIPINAVLTGNLQIKISTDIKCSHYTDKPISRAAKAAIVKSRNISLKLHYKTKTS
jgi:hypothetical protein